MNGLPKIAIALSVCWLGPLAGCSRTSDGTVVMPVKPLTVPTFDVSRILPRFGRAEPVNATQFPPAPDKPKKARSRPARRIAITQADLACVEQNQSGERARIVCR